MAGALLAGVSACEDLSPGPRQAPPSIELRGVVLRQYGDGGGLSGLGTGQVVSYLRDTGHLDGRSLVADLPASPRVGPQGLHVEAGTGAGEVGGATVTLGDGVLASTEAGDRATSRTATYRAATDVLTSDDPLTASGPTYDLSARHWLAHVHDHRLELSQGSRLQVRP
jgi:hypothetical protein